MANVGTYNTMFSKPVCGVDTDVVEQEVAYHMHANINDDITLSACRNKTIVFKMSTIDK